MDYSYICINPSEMLCDLFCARKYKTCRATQLYVNEIPTLGLFDSLSWSDRSITEKILFRMISVLTVYQSAFLYLWLSLFVSLLLLCLHLPFWGQNPDADAFSLIKWKGRLPKLDFRKTANFTEPKEPSPNIQHTHTCMCALLHYKDKVFIESVQPCIVDVLYTHTFLSPAQTALQSVKLIIMIMHSCPENTEEVMTSL